MSAPLTPDWRVELILRVQSDHTTSFAASHESSHGEQWRCRGGEKFKGEGSLKKGRRHCAEEIVAALDEALHEVTA